MSWPFAWFDGEDVLHCVGYVVKSELHWGECFVEEISEHLDHVRGEGMEEGAACLRGGDGWFPQLLEMMEGGKGKLELSEVVARRHELWGL